jgi:hypothetical protein
MKNKKSNQTTIIFKYNEKKDFVVVQDSEDRQVTLGSSVSLVDYRSLTLSYATNVLQKVLDAGVKDRFDLTELYIVASINNSYLDVFSSNDADSIFAETIENILVNNNFVEDNINGKIVMFSGGIAIGAVTESFVKANFLNLNNSVARDNLEEFRNKLDLSNNEERNESGAKVVDVFTIRGGDITSLSDEFLEVAELSEVRAFTGVDESNVISSSDAISTSAYEEDDTISIVYQYDDGGNFVAVLNSYDGSSVSTSSDDTDYGNLALSFALNATKGVLNEVENLMGEGKFWAKMGTTKPYMVATMTIGFLNAYEAERDESGDDGALAATMGQTAGGLCLINKCSGCWSKCSRHYSCVASFCRRCCSRYVNRSFYE